MQAIASGNLGGQHSEDHGEALKVLSQFGALRQDFEQGGRVNPVCRRVRLGDYSQPAGLESEYDRQANEPFVPN
jgi:hypothetical protein